MINQKNTKLFGEIIRFKKFFILLLVFTMSTLNINAQSKPIFPNTQRLVQGTDLQPGAIYILT